MRPSQSTRPEQESEYTASQKCAVAGSYLRRIDSFSTQVKAQGPSRTCNESKEEGPEYMRPSQSTRPEQESE